MFESFHLQWCKALWKRQSSVQNAEHINCLYTPTGISFIWFWKCYVSFTFLLTVYSITASLVIILFVQNVASYITEVMLGKSLTTDYKMAVKLLYEDQIKERLDKNALDALQMLDTRCLKVHFHLKRRKNFLEMPFLRQTSHFHLKKSEPSGNEISQEK